MPRAQSLQHREVGLHGLELTADPARPLEDRGAALGRHRSPPAANQQIGTELLFELADLLGHVRLNGRQHVGGGGEGALLGDGQQRVEVPEFHRLAPLVARVPIREVDGFHQS